MSHHYAGCPPCCDGGGTIDPCDCELTSVQVTWTGVFSCGWACSECGFGDPVESHAQYGEGDVTATEVTATCTKATPSACSFGGSATVTGDELVDCYTGAATGHAIRLQFAFSVVWGGSAWRVYVHVTWSMVRLSDGALFFAGSHWCSYNPLTYDKQLAFEGASATQCPDTTSYSQISGTSLCSTWSSLPGPDCSSIIFATFPFANSPGMIDFDYGSVSVS